MFEQQIEETIVSIKERTIGDNSSITLKTILTCDIPDAIKNYYNLDVKQWIKEEHDRLLNSPHFDYTDDGIRHLFREIELNSKPMIRFTEEEFMTVLDQAVKLHFNYVCRPQWTLSKFVFGDKELVSHDSISEALEYFVEYDYFKVIIDEYLKSKHYTTMHRDRFEELIAIIDTEVVKGFDSRKMAQVAQPLFELFGRNEWERATIPIEALSVFYDDKNISPIVERLDREKENIPMLSLHDLTVLVSEVDFSTSIDISNLVSRHLYPQQRPPQPPTPELTGEELAQSIIREAQASAQAQPKEPLPDSIPQNDAVELSEFEDFALDSDTASDPLEGFALAPDEEEQPLAGMREFAVQEPEPAEEEPLPEFVPEPEPEIPAFHHVDDTAFELSKDEPVEEQNEIDMEMPAEFEGFTLAPDESAEEEEQQPVVEEEDLVPDFSGFTLSDEEEEQPAPESDLITPGEQETPIFDDFLPVEDTEQPTEPTLSEEDSLSFDAALSDTNEDDGLDFNFNLDDEEEQPATESTPDSFDSFLSDLNTDDETPSPDDEFSFLTNTDEQNSEATPDDPFSFLDASTPETEGDAFSFATDLGTGDEFTPPESDIDFDDNAPLIEEAKNEYSTEDETHFNEFEFVPPDDSLTLPDLDLSLDDADGDAAQMEDGLDSGDAFNAETSSADELKDLMKDFARDQSQIAESAEEAIQSLGDLKNNIPAKDKKVYVKSLFRKDEQAFEDALDALNAKRTWREASEYIDELFLRFDIDMYSKTAIKFTDEVYKRYMPKS